MKKETLTNLELKYNPRDRGYYLEATYELETDADIRVVKVHDIRLPVNHISSNIEIEHCYPGVLPRRTIDIGFGPLDFGHYTEEVTKQKVKEVTMEDIEKKFGCKIKIVK